MENELLRKKVAILENKIIELEMEIAIQKQTQKTWRQRYWESYNKLKRVNAGGKLTSRNRDSIWKERYNRLLKKHKSLKGETEVLQIHNERWLDIAFKALEPELGFLTKELLISQTRVREICQLRQIGMSLVQKHSMLTLKQVAATFGKLDHSTVLHAVDVVQDLRDTNKAFSDMYIRILERFIAYLYEAEK